MLRAAFLPHGTVASLQGNGLAPVNYISPVVVVVGHPVLQSCNALQCSHNGRPLGKWQRFFNSVIGCQLLTSTTFQSFISGPDSVIWRQA